jgi:hypothetical protein
MTQGEIVDGHYRLDMRLGGGGFAEVWRARDLDLERDVAIKILHRHLAEDAEFVRRFRVEARRTAGLRHPHIVEIYAVAETPDARPCLVMELVAGEPLTEVLRRRRALAFDEAVATLGQLASAIDYLHAQGLVHRDLKPANVMLDMAGHATLLDLGIARAIDSAGVTRPGETIGTLAYMSPEQIRGEPAEEASDIYGLGVVAYEVLAGHPPFEGNTAAMRSAILNDAPPAGRLAVAPNEAEAAIVHALAKDPAARPHSAREFVESLRVGGGPGAPEDGNTLRVPTQTSEPAVAPEPPAAKGSHKQHRWTYLAGLVLAILAVGGVLLATLVRGWQQPPDRSQLASTGVARVGASASVTSGRAPSVAASPPAQVTRVPEASPPLAAPKQLSPASGSQIPSSHDVTWTAVPGSSFYCIQFERWASQSSGWQEPAGTGSGEERVTAGQGDQTARYAGPLTGWVAWRVWAVNDVSGRRSPGILSPWSLFSTQAAPGPKPAGQPAIAIQAC